MYVSNLSFHTTNEDLKGLFAEFGEVSSAKIINDKVSGRSRGFGFVEMSDDAAARKAMEALEGKEIEGRSLSVAVAREKEERSGNSFSGNGGGGGNRGGFKKW